MTRILADLPNEDIKWLDQLAAEQGKSGGFSAGGGLGLSAQTAMDGLEAGFGLGARHGIEIDPHEYARKRRAEWTRPWDDYYEEVRAESPDMFDEYDDRQRQIYLDMVAGKYPEVTLNEASGK